MKHFRQRTFLTTFIFLTSSILVACTSAPLFAGEPQEVALVISEEPTELQADPQQPAEPQADPEQPTESQADHATVVEAAALVETVSDEMAEEAEELEPVVTTSLVDWFQDRTLVEGAESTLVRMEHGVYGIFSAVDLEPGEAYTLWWVIFNKPENCSNGECGIDDAFLVDENGQRILADNGAPQRNVAGRTATSFSLLRATGTIVDEDGRAEFQAHLPVGDTTEANFGPGLLDAMRADIHLTIRTHGPMIPGHLHEQLNTAWGGCPEGWPKSPCGNVQSAIHSQPERQSEFYFDEMAEEVEGPEPVVTTSLVDWFQDRTLVEGAESTLVRMEHGVYGIFSAVDLEPGEAYTLWWVIFNRPENCSNGECGIDDVFLVDEDGQRILADNGAPQRNVAGRTATSFSLLRASGTIVDEDGRAEFQAHLPVGDTTEANFGPGLLDAMRADIHLTIRTHGPMIPGRLHEQLNTAWGGCPEGWPKSPCGNVQSAIHSQPDRQ